MVVTAKIGLMVSATVAALAMGTTAAAQDMAQAGPGAVGTDAANESLRTVEGADGTVVVTAPHYVPQGSVSANKTAIPLIATPQSVSVITRDQIDLLDFVDAQQAVRYTAGVFGENYGPDARYDFFTVRGFTPKQYIDGLAAPISTSIYSVGVDLYGFESLDLLKGPSSTLYGNVPPGGIYNETSRRASSTFGGEVRAQGGTNAFYEVAGTVTGPVSPILDVRFTGLYRDRDLEADLTNTKRVYVAPTATLKIDRDTTLTGLMYYQYDRGRGGNGGFLPVYGTLLPNPLGHIERDTNLDDPRDQFERRQFSVGYELVHRFSDHLRVRSNAKWNEYREAAPIGLYAGGGLINTTDPTKPSYYRTAQQYNFSYAETVNSYATDNRIEADVTTGAIRHTLLFGVDYRAVHNQAAYGFTFPNTIDVFAPVYTASTDIAVPYATRFNDQRLNQTGVYGQEQAQLGDLYLTLGGRYDWVRSHYLAPYTTDTTVNRAAAEKFTYRIGANYVTPIGIAPYVSYSTSFEPVLGTDSVTGNPYVPTTGRQWEGGLKFDARALPKGIKIFATAAAFDIKQRNVVSTLPSVTPVAGTQSGEVEVYGGEFEIVARLYDRLTINGSYSYNHSEILRSNVAAEIGAPLPTTPRHKASVFANYSLQRGALKGVSLGAGARYTSSSAGSLPVAPGPFYNPVYYGQAATLFDARVSYDVPGWRFAVNGSNILDREYVARCSGPAGCFYGAGRQVLGSITKTF